MRTLSDTRRVAVSGVELYGATKREVSWLRYGTFDTFAAVLVKRANFPRDFI